MRSFRMLSIVALTLLSACSSTNSGDSPSAPAGSQSPSGPGTAQGPAQQTEPPAPDAIAAAPSLAIPGDQFYPQSISAAADGTLFVGGIAGEVVKFTPDSVAAKPVAKDLGVIPGLIVDDVTKSVFVCGNVFNPPPPPPGQRANPFQNPTGTVYQYDFDGKLKNKYAFPDAVAGKSICEDLGFDAKHNLFITDAFQGFVFELPDGASAITKWTGDPLLVAHFPDKGQVPPFGAHGITHDPSGNLYVSNFYDSSLIRIPIEADGSAGKAVLQAISAAPGSQAPAYVQPEAVRMLDADHILGTIGAWGQPGYLVKLTKSGPDAWTSSVVRDSLKGPTSVAVSKGNYFIVEGQAHDLVEYLIGWSETPPSPKLPFLIQREPAK